MAVRFIGKGLANLVKGSPNLNVINILRTLVEDENCKIYIPQTYAAEKKTTTDLRVHFMPVETGKSIVVTAIGSHQERFNFSLTGEVEVYVEYERENGTVDLVPKIIYRTYTIVRDGKLTMDYVVGRLSEDSFNNLRHAGVLYYNGVKVPENHKYLPDYVYKIMLTDMPIVSYAWAQPLHIGMYEKLDLENKLSETLKAVNKIIKGFEEQGFVKPVFPEESRYYFEQSKGSSGPKVSAPCITYTIKNTGEVIQSYLDRITDIGSACRIKKEINKELKSTRFIIRCIVFAIELSSTKGNFNWSELAPVPRTKNKYAQTCEAAGIGRTYTITRTVYDKEF